MNKIYLVFVLVFLVGVSAFIYFRTSRGQVTSVLTDQIGDNEASEPGKISRHPLSIEALRQGNYPGSEIVIEEKLVSGSNYQRYLVSYKSEGLKIFALLTVPNGPKPESGWPVIIFNHGYIPPREYRTTERYQAYTDGFSRSGYIVFRSDYRGHGNSEGEASGSYGSSGYTIDILNAVSSVKKYPDADPNRIGMWGHSMGGHITLRNMVVSREVKAGVIWAGVVASYPDLLNNWRRTTFTPPPIPSGARRWRQQLVDIYGSPEKNPQFWNSISANFFLTDISGPLQLHHGETDVSVPVEFSRKLAGEMKAVGQEAELYEYPGDDHNLSRNFSIAMRRSVEFFDKYLKAK